MCQQCPPPRTFARRDFLKLAAAALAVPAVARAAQTEPPKPQNVLSPDDALKRLMAGNRRYVDGVAKRHDFVSERFTLVKGQNPYAAILSCADSRVAPEFAFDTGRGDVFVCRVAGNFASDESVASLEYAVAALNTPLIVVLGHSACGAVDATVKAVKDGKEFPGHIPSLIKHLAPAVKEAGPADDGLLDRAIRQNVVLNVRHLEKAGPILSKAVEEKKIRIVGGVYDLSSGRVDLVG